jgi:hypothetical protein
MKMVINGKNATVSADVIFKFKIGKANITKRWELPMEEFLRDPESYGDVLRFAFFASKDQATEVHQTLPIAQQ